MKIFGSVVLILLMLPAMAQMNPKLQAQLNQQAQASEKKIIEWRRHFHEFPELSNQEKNTGQYIADFLKGLGLKVQYPVGKTGVVGLLETGKPGPVIGLRADMDALPVTERGNLPFASRQRTVYNEKETGVMHACGHDSHMAMLMDVAEILTANRAALRGTVKFIFQPAEEGEGGAKSMIADGVMENPKVDVIFGQHIWATTPVGTILYKPGDFMAAADRFEIRIKGRQSHGSQPWNGVDPIVVGAQIVTALQTIVSRSSDLTKAAVVITVGRFNGGIRDNIIPEEAVMSGTIRTLDEGMRDMVHEKIRLTATKIAEANGATAEVILNKYGNIVINDPQLTMRMVPSLERAAGKDHVVHTQAVTGSEDFSEFQLKVPGLFIFTGAMTAGSDPSKVAAHHTPDFFIDEGAFVTGVKALLNLTVDYMYPPKNNMNLPNK